MLHCVLHFAVKTQPVGLWFKFKRKFLSDVCFWHKADIRKPPISFPILIETYGIAVGISNDHDTLPNLKFALSILPATLFCLSRFTVGF
jgi:hypothetical protein